MGYFGVAVTHMDNILAGAPNAKQLSEGLAAVENARIAGLPTARERDFVAAVGVFFQGDEKQPGPAASRRRRRGTRSLPLPGLPPRLAVAFAFSESPAYLHAVNARTSVTRMGKQRSLAQNLLRILTLPPLLTCLNFVVLNHF